MQNDLVSVISPCYNVAPYIPRFLDSLLSQTYKKLEIILVNDGSTDETGDVIKSYIPRLEQEGYSVLYIEQKNQGLAATINNALKKVTGTFLTWPDPDDWITPDSIEKRVLFLQAHPEVGLVRCNIEQIEDKTGNSLGKFEENIESPELIENLVEKLVFSQTWSGALACMARMSIIDEVIKDRDIYVSRSAGQNWQLMVPIAHKYPCWQLPDVLGYYLVRDNSHSHSQQTLTDTIQYMYMVQGIAENTLSRIQGTEQLLAKVRDYYSHIRYHYALNDKRCTRLLLFKLFLERIKIPQPYKSVRRLFQITMRFMLKGKP